MTDKNSEEDAGIDEGYREPKEKVQLAGVGLGSRAAANKPTGEGLLIRCTHPALLTGVLVSLCQSVSAALNLISMVSTSQEAPKHPGEMLAGDGGRRPCKTSSGLKPGPPGSHAIFLCCPCDKAWCFFINGDCFNTPYISHCIHIDLEWNAQEDTTLLFLNCGMFSS